VTLSEQKLVAAQLAELWTALMPDLEVPAPEQFMVWAGRDTFDIISMGINRAAGKRLTLRGTPTPMTLDGVLRYASGVMRNVRNDLIAQRQAAAA
jgi:hypothetical protein